MVVVVAAVVVVVVVMMLGREIVVKVDENGVIVVVTNGVYKSMLTFESRYTVVNVMYDSMIVSVAVIVISVSGDSLVDVYWAMLVVGCDSGGKLMLCVMYWVYTMSTDVS